MSDLTKRRLQWAGILAMNAVVPLSGLTMADWHARRWYPKQAWKR